MKEKKYVRITIEEIAILRKLIGAQIQTIYSPGLTVNEETFWSTSFSIDTTGASIDSPNFKPYLKIWADYKQSETSTTFFQFEISEEQTPTGVERTKDNSLLWPFGEQHIWSQPIRKISIYEDWNEEDETIIFDRLIVIQTTKELFCFEAEDSVLGGVNFIKSKRAIKRILKKLKLNVEIDAR